MSIVYKSTYGWDSTLYKIIFISVICFSVCSLPLKPPSVVDETRNTKNLKEKLKASVLSTNLKSIVRREYARYFNGSLFNSTVDDDLSHECLLGPSQYYIWWLDSHGNVRPGLNTRNAIALDLSNKGLIERNLPSFVSLDKNHVCLYRVFQIKMDCYPFNHFFCRFLPF